MLGIVKRLCIVLACGAFWHICAQAFLRYALHERNPHGVDLFFAYFASMAGIVIGAIIVVAILNFIFNGVDGFEPPSGAASDDADMSAATSAAITTAVITSTIANS